MDFTFTQDQKSFRDAVRAAFMVEATPDVVREGWEHASGVAPSLAGLIAEQGLTALSVPEAFGGLALSDTDWALLTQEFGYYAVPDALLTTSYPAACLIRELPDAANRQQAWLPALCEGRLSVAVGHPLSPLVGDADRADLLLLWHEDEVHALPRADVDIAPVASVDPSRRLCRVSWNPSSASRVADAEAGRGLWQRLVDRMALAIAGQQLGLTQRILDLAIDYTAQRKQFGKPIGSFQAVKHLLADVAVKSEFARPVLGRAAYALEHGHPNAGAYVSHARLACGEAAWLAARNGIQVHGAIGYTWECDLQIYMKRVWALESAWGDAAYHKARVADWVLADGAAGPGVTFA
ncbi:acyl-CoA dehydrogenase family protein [Crenobacter intestini]|uniref:Acyl-CoA dehydrogenase n=1 Tax=Crenobacter intestini TaxID=2563443 RepID=A0A4T0V5Y6_9NEIS|nr:acyl-CoA dehydrogenase family protein [Crenobacter intestini]TIC86847.1 acyl-CoA dehydrogenase [Crenobacter intestini]